MTPSKHVDATALTAHAVTWHCERQIVQIEEFRQEWHRLLKKCDTDPLFNSFEWIEHWIDHYWQRHWQLKLHYALSNGETVAILPLYIQPSSSPLGLTRCYPLGQGEPESMEVASEYQDLLIAPGWLEILTPQIQKILRTTADQLCWRAAVSGAAILTCMPNPMVQSDHHLVRYWIMTPEWRHSLMSKNFRAQRNKGLKRLQERVHRFQWVAKNELSTYFCKLKELHCSRWADIGKHGAFSTSEFNAFHQSLISSSKWPRISVLTVDNDVAAVHYYLKCGDTLYFYQSGWDSRRYHQYSPGLLLHCWSIENTDCDIYDFMMGGSYGGYKARFKPMITPMLSLHQPLSKKAYLINWVKALFMKLRR